MHPTTFQVRDSENPRVTWEIDLHNNTRTMRDDSGKLITMDLGVADVHIDSALANYAAGYRMYDGIADKVAPIVPTPKASDKYFTWDKNDVFQQAEDLIVAPGGAVKEISPRLSNTSFSTVGYGIASAVPTELTANADAPLKPEMAAVRRCMNAILLGHEVRVATASLLSSNWTGGYVAAATAKWNGGATSNPIGDIYTAIESSLTPVHAIVMSERTWHDFVTNAAVQKFVASKIDIPPLPNAQAGTTVSIADKFSAILGLPPILIGRVKYLSAAATYSYVWGNSVVLINNDPTIPSDGQTISTFKNFRWSGADSGVPDGTVQGGFLVRSYFDPRRGARGSRVVVVTHNDAFAVTSVYAGGLITGAHA